MSPLSETLRTALREALAGCVERAGRLRRVQWLALRRSDPAAWAPDALAAFEGWRGGPRFYWEQPSRERAMAAQGELFAIETRGPDRFAEASRLAQSLFGDLRVVGDEGGADAGPLLVGGFAFRDESGSTARFQAEWRDFPPGRLVLPERMLVRSGEWAHRCWVHPIVPGARADAEWRSFEARLAGDFVDTRPPATDSPAPGAYELGPEYRVRADRPHAAFLAQVREAVARMEGGGLDKVVLARSLAVRRGGLPRGGRFELEPFLAALRRIYPTCTTFAVDRGAAAFVGATPECLVALADGWVETAALAGSAPRGRSPEEDDQLGDALRASPKEQEEHALVVRGIRESLAGFCGPLGVPDAPRLRRLEGIQHLETPIAGALRPDLAKSATVLDLVAALHPTPAVAGLPRDASLAWIAEHEGLARGWYAGPVGFVDARGEGEFRVALRSGLVRGGEARLFAGAGLLPDSDADAELQETRIKLRALLAPLTEI